VATGDLDGDGFVDIVVANNVADTVGIFINRGDGTFADQVTYSAGSNHAGPFWVAVGDFDGDGHPDLAVAEYLSVNVFVNRGDGTFRASDSMPSTPGSVTVADLNGDGHPDIVSANTNGAYLDTSQGNLSTFDSISLFLNDGGGSFPTQTFLATGHGAGPGQIVAGDIDGDGALDLVVSNTMAQGVSVFLNNGDGTFQSVTILPMRGSSQSVAMGDLNGDGHLDIAAANCFGNDVAVFINIGDGTFGSEVDYAVGFEPNYLTISDLNGDGYADIQVANSQDSSAQSDLGGVGILFGRGDGTFAPQTVLPLGTSVSSLAIADLRRSGSLDIVAPSVCGPLTVLLRGCFP
jgi:hypothetical protein